MEKSFASLMSLLLLMAQFFLTTAECRSDVPFASFAVRSGQPSCCRASKMACNAPCCLSRDTTSRDASTPDAPAPFSYRAAFLAAAVLTTFWTLPISAELRHSSAASADAAALAPAVPLFLRHGALLI